MMFLECSSLKKIEFFNIDTSEVYYMKGMFDGCEELEYIDLSPFDTSNVTLMSNMFNRCHKLKEIKGINNFNTSKVIIMEEMFKECYELEILDLTNFNSPKISNMKCMFKDCHKLKEVKGINKSIVFNYINTPDFDNIILGDFDGLYGKMSKIKKLTIDMNNSELIKHIERYQIFLGCNELIKDLDFRQTLKNIDFYQILKR